jgi:phenylacetate-CoA ligase
MTTLPQPVQAIPTETAAANGEVMALELFHAAAARVPAYKDFLAQAGIDVSSIKTYQDFIRHIPLMDKKDYLRQYALPELCMDGNLFHNRIISVSSGSSGEPFFWPRGAAQDNDGTEMHTQIYDHIFKMNQQKTLLVICFSMGTWIAGSFTTISSFGYVDKGNPVNIVTPGLEKTEAVNAIKNLSHLYDQIVITGYPPFVKDIIEQGKAAGIDWSKLKTRLLMAGEAFSEEWRDYILGMIHSDDPYHDAINIFGSADAGMLGHETPLSILVRRLYNEDPELCQEVFGTDILPSIVQYDPAARHFEAVNGELVFSSKAGIPLVRYNIKDTGGVLSYDQVTAPIKDKLEAALAKYNIDVSHWQKPFVYLNGRKDFSVTIYAVNIYPENIKAGLIDERLRDWTTGRFTMATKNHSDMDQYFEITVELAENCIIDDEQQTLITEVIVEHLKKLNAEYRKLYSAIGDKARPHVRLVAFGHPDYFATGVKHRWVKKES